MIILKILPLMFFITLPIHELEAKEAVSVKPDSAPSIPAEALRFFSLRHTNPAFMDSSARLLENHLREHPDDRASLVLLSEVYLKWADHVNEKKRTLALLEKGYRRAVQALELDSTDAQAHLWATSNLALIGKTKGIMNSLRTLPEIRSGIAHALNLDPSNPKILIAQATILMELPSFMGGDLDSAEIYLRRSLSIDPYYANAKIKLAEVLIRKKRNAKARELLRDVLNMKNPSDIADYRLTNLPAARELLDKIGEK